MNFIVTGTTSGIGAALVEDLVKRGHRVATFVRKSNMAKAEDLLRSHRTLICPVDVTDSSAVAWGVGLAFDKMGWIDGVVNNAGINHLSLVDYYGDRQFMKVLETNTIAPMAIVRECLMHWKRRSEPWEDVRTPRIVNVSSIGATIPMRASSMYCASKAALSMLTQCWAREFAGRFFVAEVRPGRIEGTEMHDAAQQQYEDIFGIPSDDSTKYALSRIPLQRYGRVDEVVDAIRFLLLDAPMYMSGASLVVAGAQT